MWRIVLQRLQSTNTCCIDILLSRAMPTQSISQLSQTRQPVCIHRSSSHCRDSRSGIPIPVTDEEPEYEGFDENKPVEFVRKETWNLHTGKSEKVGTSKPRNYLNVGIAEQPNPCQRRGYTPISMEKQTRMNLEELQSVPDGATEPLYSNSELGDVEPLYTNNVTEEDMEPYYSDGDLREGVEPYYTNNNFR